MENQEKGEIAVDAGGVRHIIKVGTNALANLEAATGKTYQEYFAWIQQEENQSFTAMRQLVQAVTTREGQPLTDIEAGDFMDAVGISEIMDKVGQAAALAFPEAQAGGDDAAPGKS